MCDSIHWRASYLHNEKGRQTFDVACHCQTNIDLAPDWNKVQSKLTSIRLRPHQVHVSYFFTFDLILMSENLFSRQLYLVICVPAVKRLIEKKCCKFGSGCEKLANSPNIPCLKVIGITEHYDCLSSKLNS